MHKLKQFGLVAGILFVGHAVTHLLSLPIPGTVLGMLILLALLIAGVVRLELVEDIAHTLLPLMMLFLIPPSLAFSNAVGLLAGWWWILLLIAVVSAVAILVVTGRTIQWLMKRDAK